jgi:microcystin-dependent protein
MANPYVGEIRVFAGNFAPSGWALCDGSLVAISANPTLYSLLGTTYGGNGTTNFALPDLRGRAPINQGTSATGTSYVLGQTGGTETVTLQAAQLPSHQHNLLGTTSTGTSANPGPTLAMAVTPNGEPLYDGNQAIGVPLAGPAVSNSGGSQPHDNRQPYLAINYIISLFGIYPSPT